MVWELYVVVAEWLQEMDEEEKEKRGWESFRSFLRWWQPFPSQCCKSKPKCQALKLSRGLGWMKEKERNGWGITGSQRFWKYINCCQRVRSAELNLWLMYICVYSPKTICLSIRFERQPFNSSHADADGDTSQITKPPQDRPVTPSSFFPKRHFYSRGWNLSEEKWGMVPALWIWAKSVLQYTQWQRAWWHKNGFSPLKLLCVCVCVFSQSLQMDNSESSFYILAQHTKQFGASWHDSFKTLQSKISIAHKANAYK